MQAFSLIFALSLFLSLVSCGKFHAHECVRSKSCHSHDFQEVESPKHDDEITLSFAVKLNHVERLYEVLEEVSDPSSPKFGKHWTFEQVNQLVSNEPGRKKVMKHLLKFVNETQISISGSGGFVKVMTDIKTAQHLLKTEFKKFRSERTGEEVVRTLMFEVPSEVSELIDYIFPTTQFPSTIGKRSVVMSHEVSARAVGLMTPNILKSFYNISNIVSNVRASQSIFASNSQSFVPKDLNTFQSSFGLRPDSVDSIVGSNTPSACQTDPSNCFEASLDLQYLMAVSQQAPTTYWSTDSSFSSWMEEVSSTPNPPLVHSISYGTYEEYTSFDEQLRFAQEVAKLGTQGVTVVVASGDDGVSNYGARNNAGYCGFQASYPANIPYVLSVGATMGPESGASVETPCSSDKGSPITTAGGFSRMFQRPKYQSELVLKYMNPIYNSSSPLPLYQPPKTMFNPFGRAFPDVSIAGNNYQIIINGKIYVVSGTSAAAPVFAGIISLANSARMNIGKSSLGWLNPTLYQLFSTTPSIFKDVQTGNNRCTASSVCCPYGFNARAGWDPVTGLGSVNAGRLIEALVQL